ncbi:hypothetical protein NU688_07975 [Variovorax sp. ZS18.2.2]|uniref:hypothetical protein n=1 Tax=Variovorax sp. ZS18.2.2 TaxID=2971255 RepID=UPI002151B3A5|nr:hypothetical protein [Variovorax sp. ZS18.2.2]MCR6476090.1 hypothetical protein [Variovorax sp. ZS18.2.2]
MTNFETYAKILENKAQELFELIESDKFLAGKYLAKQNEIVIKNPDDAVIFACDQDVDIVKGEEYQYWTNILENHARTEERVDEKENLGLNREFNDLSEKIFDEKIMSAINEKAEALGIPEPLIDVIVGNFLIFLMNRVLLREQSSFDESLYSVYEKGGVPCGWKGEYPEGSMLVFSAD